MRSSSASHRRRGRRRSRLGPKSFYYAPQYYEKIGGLKVGFAEIDFAEWPASRCVPRSPTRSPP